MKLKKYIKIFNNFSQSTIKEVTQTNLNPAKIKHRIGVIKDERLQIKIKQIALKKNK